MSPFEEPNTALLPSGFIDLLQHEAEAEARGIEAVMDVFARHGYERVRPPLLEFEASLLHGAGQALSEQTFRLMDPESRRMMGLRPDMTTQVARIAATRLVGSPRPLRLSYAGACVVVGTPGREGERQITQAGIELIGVDSAAADAEVVLVAAEALARLRIAHVSFDLSYPALVQSLIAEAGLSDMTRAQLVHAVDRKDAAAVTELGGEIAPVLTAMLHAAGPADAALAALAGLDLPPAIRTMADRLRDVVAVIAARAPDLRLTVDPVELRGWQYHTGICMTVFARGQREELGRGGRYLAYDEEAACGLTLRPEVLLRAAAPIELRRRVYVPAGMPESVAACLREKGYATVAGLSAVDDSQNEGRRLGCAYVLSNDDLIEL
ncbi:histidyl-tRNA synthetase [Neoasaia chiangmaiensis NBRC 101099]|uniref:ATP phosphoribosyltransferase regulatory subunit n=1 Tax=Neoasaia chiangmaiensis TaxID=320497 RepID=A0A1U9KNY3_9PROT|nr:ATP phosphoribosyltransferase regulatory subunit [Neoasaia chiangmaiensis]AQS87504.1 ATP phosphoribosyltransferase regulatory subunit [Neoasaia chiangmaiensis]GBR42463.1 histidyl-tRNA synthetase [Neoasaia chiangmaiensis NBRC 101099]GEN16302.1 ATP phosphoribosyltransferase regulatory subunit [Neoasaia chiangmaiensis]